MKLFYLIVPVVFSIYIGGCGTVGQSKKEPDHTVSTILESNKEHLTYIKNRTADDLELGYKVRALSKKQISDEELGSKVRALVSKQEGDSNVTEIHSKTSEINNRLNVLILLIVIIILIGVISKIFIDMKKRGGNERVVTKPIGKLGNKTPSK